MPCNRIFYQSHDNLRERHYLLSDEDFARAFEECTLEPTIFSHEAHLRLAWILIRSHGLLPASEMLCKQIMKFDLLHGKGTKFSKTLTLAAARLVHDLQERSQDRTFRDFIKSNLCLLGNFRQLLAPYTESPEDSRPDG
jgi:hypothetical protein